MAEESPVSPDELAAVAMAAEAEEIVTVASRIEPSEFRGFLEGPMALKDGTRKLPR